jgi:hypothetical protein
MHMHIVTVGRSMHCIKRVQGFDVVQCLAAAAAAGGRHD